MLSLFILFAILIISLLATAWATAFVARLVGSPRARLRTAVPAILLITLFGLILSSLQQLLPFTPHHLPPSNALHSPPPQPLGTPALLGLLAPALLLLAAELIVPFLILRRAFRLSTSRAFAPFGAFFGTNILILFLYVLVLRPHLIETFFIPTASMAPTLEINDRFVVSKILTPRRWDIVAYHSTDPQRSIWCKRLVGLPGDRLRFENNQLFINDQPAALPAPLVGHLRAATTGIPPSQALYHDGETITLGPDQYFLIGDHAEQSADSRYYGPSPRVDLVGVADLIYWPPHNFRILR